MSGTVLYIDIDVGNFLVRTGYFAQISHYLTEKHIRDKLPRNFPLGVGTFHFPSCGAMLNVEKPVLGMSFIPRQLKEVR